MTNIFGTIGKKTLSFLSLFERFGAFIFFQLSLIPLIFKKPYRLREVVVQIDSIGAGTFGVILLTAFFTGMVVTIQLYDSFHKFGTEAFIGFTVFISIAKELGPVFGGLMLISRSISSMAAELGTMRVTEQIDALDCLSVNSKKYLLIPRILATMISLPILIIIFDFFGNLSAYLVSIYALGISENSYLSNIKQMVEFEDVAQGIIKGVIFGYLIGSIGSYMGYFAKGGAKGVGIATIKAVIYSAITIFAANYFISAVFILI
ncbi:MAG: ABC transporter permease [Epsilonproteobacteria bacterium]|nr:ABC transporter permease [Campylobacterota bacterium]